MLDSRGSGFAAFRCLFFFVFSMFICLLFLCNISSALTTIELTKEGRDIDLILRDPKDKIQKMSNGNVKMTSASLRYRWDVAQYIDYLDSMYMTINVVSTDDAGCDEDGNDWTKFYVYGTDSQWHKVGNLDTTGSIRKELIGSNWSPFRHYSGGKWYVDIRVTAPHCSGARDDADIEISQLKLELKVDSKTQLSRSRVKFGKLYFPKYESGGTVNSGALNDTAVDYNEKQEQQIKIKNVGYGNLNWSIKSKPSGLTFSDVSGSVARNSEQTITLKLGSPKGTDSNYSNEVVLQTDDGSPNNDKFTITATLYDTPKIQHIPPEVGWKNNIVHVAVDDSEARFEVSKADPFFPKPGGGILPVKRHEWQSTGQGASPTASGWRPGQRVATGAQCNWSTPGRYDLHCRMVDDNGVATEPVKISVRVWARPIVNSEPPDTSAVDWYGNEEAGFAYVGIVGQPVRFKGSATPNPDNNTSYELKPDINLRQLDSGNTLCQKDYRDHPTLAYVTFELGNGITLRENPYRPTSGMTAAAICWERMGQKL